MNTTRDQSVSEQGEMPHTRSLLGRWIAAIVLIAILAGAAFGWLPAYVALPAVAIVAAFIAVEIRSASKGIPVARPEALAAESNNFGAQLAAIINALPEPVLLVDRANKLLAGNVAAAAIFGRLRVNEPISLTLRNPQIVDAVGRAASGISQNFEVNERLPVERSLDAHVVPLVFGEEQPKLFLLTFRDRTQERRVEQMRVDFVANASHELRTPLASLSGFIDTLLGPARDDSAAREKFLGIMSDQARRMSRLIDDLMSLSRIELSLHLQPQTQVDLAELVSRACDILAPLAKERGVALEVKREAAKLEVRGDRDELIRVFENLIENALKYGASGKRVEVTLRAEEGEALVAIRDFGPGIAPEHLPRLTERFYRVDVERSRAQGGTGLGLALAKHVLARHRGRLTIESESGQGAIFTARIPLL
jgi:two-component system phosphate regulon sensor histidine kinase PhoR